MPRKSLAREMIIDQGEDIENSLPRSIQRLVGHFIIINIASTLSIVICSMFCISLIQKRFLRNPLKHLVKEDFLKKPRLPLNESISNTMEAMQLMDQAYPRLYATINLHNQPFTVTRGEIIWTHRLKDVQVSKT